MRGVQQEVAPRGICQATIERHGCQDNMPEMPIIWLLLSEHHMRTAPNGSAYKNIYEYVLFQIGSTFCNVVDHLVIRFP